MFPEAHSKHPGGQDRLDMVLVDVLVLVLVLVVVVVLVGGLKICC